MLARVHDQLQNVAKYDGKILHADPCRTCLGHVLVQCQLGS